MAALKSRDAAVSASAVRVLCGLLHNKFVDLEILSVAGKTPHVRIAKQALSCPVALDAFVHDVAPPAVGMCINGLY